MADFHAAPPPKSCRPDVSIADFSAYLGSVQHLYRRFVQNHEAQPSIEASGFDSAAYLQVSGNALLFYFWLWFAVICAMRLRRVHRPTLLNFCCVCVRNRRPFPANFSGPSST